MDVARDISGLFKNSSAGQIKLVLIALFFIVITSALIFAANSTFDGLNFESPSFEINSSTEPSASGLFVPPSNFSLPDLSLEKDPSLEDQVEEEINIFKTTLELITNTVSAIVGEFISIQAILTYENDTPIPDQQIKFYADEYLGFDITDLEGKAEIEWDSSQLLPDFYSLTANFDGDESLDISLATIEIELLKAEILEEEVNETNETQETNETFSGETSSEEIPSEGDNELSILPLTPENENLGEVNEINETTSEETSEPINIIQTTLKLITDTVLAIIGELVSIQAILTYENDTPISGQQVEFYADEYLGSDVTDFQGKAAIQWNTSLLLPAFYSLSVNFTGDALFNSSSASLGITLSEVEVEVEINETFLEILPVNETVNFTANVTTNIPSNITLTDLIITELGLDQGKAEIGKPVKWKKRIKVENPSDVELINQEIEVELPPFFENLIVIDLVDLENEIVDGQITPPQIMGAFGTGFEIGTEFGIEFGSKIKKWTEKKIPPKSFLLYDLEYETPAPEMEEFEDNESNLVKKL